MYTLSGYSVYHRVVCNACILVCSMPYMQCVVGQRLAGDDEQDLASPCHIGGHQKSPLSILQPRTHHFYTPVITSIPPTPLPYNNHPYVHLNVLSLNSHSSQSRGWHKTVSGCRCSSWTSQPLEKPLTEKAPPLQAIVQIMRPFFCPLSFTPNVYNWSHQIFLHLPQMLLGVNALSIERFSVLRIRATKLENPKVQPKSKIPC